MEQTGVEGLPGEYDKCASPKILYDTSEPLAETAD